MKLTTHEQQVLLAWVGTNEENNVLSFSTISDWSRVHRSKIRRIVRSLARKGFVELTTGFNDEGMIMGRGYMPTMAGHAEIAKAEAPPREGSDYQMEAAE